MTSAANRSKGAARWAEYWDRQSTPLNMEETAEYYEKYGAELALLFRTLAPASVLEIGCGDGALVSPLGFDVVERYVGVEPSHRMISAYRERHPQLETIEADGTSFEVDGTFDLIFSCAVVQFMDTETMEAHLSRIVPLLNPGGMIVWASVPWTRMRWAYARRDLAGGTRRSLPLAAAAHLKRRLFHDNMGYWYDTPQLSDLAQRWNLSVEFFGSLNYPYRFHAVFSKPNS